jgi:prepilin-type N-terminal cleavage/methylation domain-containing protein
LKHKNVHRISNDDGFTLLEVLVATAITSLAFASLFSIISDSKFITTSMTKRIEGIYLAETLLEEHSLNPAIINFPIEGENDDWKWALSIVAYDDELDTPQNDRVAGAPYVIIITIEDKYSLYTHNLSLSNLVWLEE